MTEPTNNIGDGNIALPDAKPLLKLKKSNFLNVDVYEVDNKTYHQTLKGHKHGDRWNKCVSCQDNRALIKKLYQRGKPIIIKDSQTGNMHYLRR